MIEERINIKGNVENKGSVLGSINKGTTQIEPKTQEKSVTPTKQEQEVVYDEGYTGLSKVVVNPIPNEYIIPSGNLEITTNDTFDVKEYSTVTTNVMVVKKTKAPEALRFENSTLTNDEIVDVLNSFDFSEKKSFNYLFSGVKGVTIFPLIDTSSGTSFGRMYSGCSACTSFPSLNTSNGMLFDNMFISCGKLVTAPVLDTSNGTNFSGMFQNCSLLENVPLYDTTNDYANDFSNMFRYCYRLVNVPHLNLKNATSIVSMFNGCSRIVTIPDFGFTKVNGLNTAFYGCTSLQDLPAFNLVRVTNIYNLQNMVGNCTSLTDESLNNLMASLISTRIVSTANKTLKYVGLTSDQATRCQSLSNYEALINAGWSTGY